jgi:hypothetical protein
MNRRPALLSRLVLVCGSALLIGLAASASEKPSEDYVKAMRTLQTVAEALPESLAAEDHEAMDRLVIAARPALAVLEKYWIDRQVEEALLIAQKASKAIAEISVAVHLMTSGPNLLAVEGAQESIQSFVAACAACHAAHREKLPDGSFAIK